MLLYEVADKDQTALFLKNKFAKNNIAVCQKCYYGKKTPPILVCLQ